MLKATIATNKLPLQALSFPPLLSSIKAGWNNIYLEFHCQTAGEVPKCYAKQHALCIYTGGRQRRSERWLDERFHSQCMGNGDVFVVPEKVAYRAQWDGDGAVKFIVLLLDPLLVTRVAYETVDPDQIEIVPSFPKPDPLIYQIGLALKVTLEIDGMDSCLYAEMMANALAVHLLQYYSTSKPLLRDYVGGLPKHKLKQVLEYIDECLDRTLSVAELAELLQMSSHYFGRLFKQSMELTPHQYIIQRRVERAKQMLLSNQLSLAEIAQSVGFAHQSHFNYHFKRLIGVTPRLFQEK